MPLEDVERNYKREAFAIAAGETMMLAQNEHVRVLAAINELLLNACRIVSAAADADCRIDLRDIHHAILKVREVIKITEGHDAQTPQIRS